MIDAFVRMNVFRIIFEAYLATLIGELDWWPKYCVKLGTDIHFPVSLSLSLCNIFCEYNEQMNCRSDCAWRRSGYLQHQCRRNYHKHSHFGEFDPFANRIVLEYRGH